MFTEVMFTVTHFHLQFEKHQKLCRKHVCRGCQKVFDFKSNVCIWHRMSMFYPNLIFFSKIALQTIVVSLFLQMWLFSYIFPPSFKPLAPWWWRQLGRRLETSSQSHNMWSSQQPPTNHGDTPSQEGCLHQVHRQPSQGERVLRHFSTL